MTGIGIWLPVVVTATILIAWCLKLILSRSSSSSEWPNRTTLLITAHPDDECMFFAPTIIHLLSLDQKLILLCLSEGDYYGSGPTRKKELYEACKVLGLPSESVVVINDSRLPDDPQLNWSTELVGQHIVEAVRRYNVKRIITFDEVGVSGHTNHVSIHMSLRKLLFDSQKEIQGDIGPVYLFPGCEVLYLKSANILGKYSSFLGVLITQIFSICHQKDYYYILSSFDSWFIAQRALSKHESQMVWFRQIYRLLSNYLIVNKYTTHHTKKTHFEK